MDADKSCATMNLIDNSTTSANYTYNDTKELEANDIKGSIQCEQFKEQNMPVCKVHPQLTQTCVCETCKVTICFKCRNQDHGSHDVKEVSEFTKQIHHQIESLRDKAELKVAGIEAYTQLVNEQEAKIEVLLKGKITDIITAYKESVQRLTRRKNDLITECHQYQQEMKEKFQCIRDRNYTVIEDISKASALVAEDVGVGLLEESITLYDTLFTEFNDKLDAEEGDWELKSVLREADDTEFVRFVGQRELDLGEIIRKTDWNLDVAHVCPLVEEAVCDMNPALGDGLLVGYSNAGIALLTASGTQEILVEEVRPRGLATLSTGDIVVQDDDNTISIFSPQSVKSGVTFDTPVQGFLDAFAVDKDDNILLAHGEWSEQADKILVFRPEGGGPVREIPCRGFEPHCICPMNLSSRIVVRDHSTVWVIDGDGTKRHSITKVGSFASPAVLRDDSILIAWERNGQLGIDLYTSELEHIRTVFPNINTKESEYIVFLKVLSTGLVVFNDSDNLYILRKS